MPDVFISYNREDRETARLVANALEAEGLSVWWDAALRAGETYDEVTEQNLRGAGAVVVLWSKRSVNSKWVRAEATVGERSSSLVPVLIEECERPIRFELVQTADLRHWRGDRHDPHWRAFMQDVSIAISRRGDKSAAAAPASVGVEASMETTFWNSIKDGTDRSDFEAYLKRYPNGHFASLAQNRIAALSRARPAQPQRPAAAPSAAQQPQRRPQAAPPPRPAQRATAAKPAPKKSGAGLLIGVVILLLGGAGVGAYFLMRGGAEKDAVSLADATPAVEATAATASKEPAPDILSQAQTAETEEAAALEGQIIDPATEENVESGTALSLAGVAAVGSEPIDPSTPPEDETGAKDRAFQDCDSCPLMMPLAGGAFVMGSPNDEPGRNGYEGPQREVTVKSFAIGVYEVTNAEWKACVDKGACTAKREGDDRAPALGVSWREASDYVRWLSRETGRNYRLPSEAEWEYAARGGSTGAYWWGDRFDASRVATKEPKPVGTFDPNGFGLYDVLGNAREWVADCYVNTYVNAPTDGSAVTDGDCAMRVVRGGAYSSAPVDMRVANRVRNAIGVGARYMGFRVAADAP